VEKLYQKLKCAAQGFFGMKAEYFEKIRKPATQKKIVPDNLVMLYILGDQ
jgi:hypothetical protein